MPFVLDASVAASWAFEDEDHPIAKLTAKRIREDQAHVPSLWWFEVRNTLIVNERRGRLTENITTSFLHHLAEMKIVIEWLPQQESIFALSRRHRLTVYDAAYLELALRKGYPLATLDTTLAAAAQAEQAALIR